MSIDTGAIRNRAARESVVAQISRQPGEKRESDVTRVEGTPEEASNAPPKDTDRSEVIQGGSEGSLPGPGEMSDQPGDLLPTAADDVRRTPGSQSESNREMQEQSGGVAETMVSGLRESADVRREPGSQAERRIEEQRTTRARRERRQQRREETKRQREMESESNRRADEAARDGVPNDTLTDLARTPDGRPPLAQMPRVGASVNDDSLSTVSSMFGILGTLGGLL